MTNTFKKRSSGIVASTLLSLALGLAGSPAMASFALGFVQNETAGATPNGDYNIDYTDYSNNPEKFLAFGPRVNTGTSSVLRFKAFVGDEWDADPGNADQFSVWASTDGSSIGYNLLASSAPSLGGVPVPEWGGVPGYVDVVVDLSGYANQALWLAFSFDPLDDVNNNYAGVRIDNISITQGADTLFAEDFESGQANGWQLNGLWHVTDNAAFVPEPSSPMLIVAAALAAGLATRRGRQQGR